MGIEVKENEQATNSRAERLRPRRLEPDTLSYLKEVSEMLQSGDSSEEDVELLMWNVLEEIAPRSASASSDRHACEMIEALFPKMSALQLRFFVSKMEGYFSHLWTNRYSSHVLQNVLSRSNAIIEQEISESDEQDESEEDERAKDTPTMTTIIINMVQELQEEWGTLMNDVSASHVWRSIFAVLAGKPLMPEKRGRNAKHRAISFGDKNSNITYSVPESFGNLFAEVLNALINAPADVLNNLMYDRNSGPVISMALKFAPEELQQQLIQHILEWKNEKHSGKIFYNFAGDSVTSHFLEAVFDVCDKEFFIQIFDRCLKGKLLEYSENNIANYVIQHVIQCIPTKELAMQVFEELSQALWTLFSKGKPGVVWRLIELCVKFEIKQKELYDLLFDAVKNQESKKPEAVRKDVVPALLNLQLSTAQNTKLTLNVTGAKIIENLMKFNVSITKDLFKSIFKLNTVQLVALAKDSTGSRCVIEPIWESNEPELKWAQDKLYERFIGHFGTLALDRIGAFSVMKCYEKLELKQKAVVAEELLKVENKLAGSHFSQLVLNTCHVYEFRNNREKWEALYSKKKKIEKLFADVDADTSMTLPSKEKKNKKKKSSKEKDEKKSKRKHQTDDEDDENIQESQKDMEIIFDVLGNKSKESAKSKKKSKKSKKQKQE